jgi:hypothetical protein
MRKFCVAPFFAATLALFSINTHADVIQPMLNQVTLQLSAEKWATTNTANVSVAVDAALDKLELTTANTEIMKKLQKIANTPDWHITQFVRNQDKTGLEQLHVEAEARLPQNSLAGLRDNAKSISKPGETYTIDNIDFTPSLAEIEQTSTDVRNQIYNNAKQEVARLNQQYPNAHYFLYTIEFSSPIPRPGPIVMNKMIAISASAGNPMSVSARVMQTATVVIAAQTPVTLQVSANNK